MTKPQNDNALRERGVAGKAINPSAKRITKIQRVDDAMKRPQGLNRFEAERIGEHCLNSSVSILRKRYGARLRQSWETVPTRYCETGVKVLRYWLTGDS